MADFTPGPWKVSLHGDKGDFEIRPADQTASEGDGWLVKSNHSFVVAAETMHANARLIAASPDMLTTLEHTLAWLESWDGCGSIGATEKPRAIADIRTAIAKANGATP